MRMHSFALRKASRYDGIDVIAAQVVSASERGAIFETPVSSRGRTGHDCSSALGTEEVGALDQADLESEDDCLHTIT
ncbi:hypothetical protein GCM10020255_069300 [Rhodococcus baikonurensis]